MTAVREDFKEIARLVRPGSRVLDVGCGEGTLLELLAREKGVDGRGIEISPEGVSACLARGLAVVQGDADRDLDDFLPGAFDYVILSQTLQAVLKPRHVLRELLRIGGQAIVTLPNFGHWRARLDLLFHGRMPVTGALPEPWWSTPEHPPLHPARLYKALRGAEPCHRRLRRPRRGPTRTPRQSHQSAGDLARRSVAVHAEP